MRARRGQLPAVGGEDTAGFGELGVGGGDASGVAGEIAAGLGEFGVGGGDAGGVAGEIAAGFGELGVGGEYAGGVVGEVAAGFGELRRRQGRVLADAVGPAGGVGDLGLQLIGARLGGLQLDRAVGEAGGEAVALGLQGGSVNAQAVLFGTQAGELLGQRVARGGGGGELAVQFGEGEAQFAGTAAFEGQHVG